MAASKPISWLYKKKTSFISLNNNFGTLNSCSGLFPFRHTTLSYYVRLFNIHYSPSEKKNSLIKSSRFPNVYKKEKFFFVWDHISVPTNMLFELPTYIGFAETDLPLQSILRQSRGPSP